MNRNHLLYVSLAGLVTGAAGAAFGHGGWMAFGILTCVLALLAWDIANYVEPQPNLRTYRADVWARRDQETADHELPYQPIDRGAIWPQQAGAPE